MQQRACVDNHSHRTLVTACGMLAMLLTGPASSTRRVTIWPPSVDARLVPGPMTSRNTGGAKEAPDNGTLGVRCPQTSAENRRLRPTPGAVMQSSPVCGAPGILEQVIWYWKAPDASVYVSCTAK